MHRIVKNLSSWLGRNRPKTRQTRSVRLELEELEGRDLMALVVPVLNSNPGAPASIYLDFDGHFESAWGGYRNVSTRELPLVASFTGRAARP